MYKNLALDIEPQRISAELINIAKNTKGIEPQDIPGELINKVFSGSLNIGFNEPEKDLMD